MPADDDYPNPNPRVVGSSRPEAWRDKMEELLRLAPSSSNQQRLKSPVRNTIDGNDSVITAAEQTCHLLMGPATAPPETTKWHESRDAIAARHATNS